MPQHAEFHRRRGPRQQKDCGAVVTNETDSSLIRSFRAYAQELDTKHDRHERIVKLSRDITIESKRIIFLLHTIDGRKNNIAKILLEAGQRLNKLIEVNFKAVAKELRGRDVYQHRHAYSPGLQEFIEAYSFYEYFKSVAAEDGKVTVLSDWSALQQQMQYMETQAEEDVLPEAQIAQDGDAKEEAPVSKFEFFVDPTEYILGVADLTGELMRRCINSLGSGETEACLDTCQVLQQLYSGYLSLNTQRCRELSRKIYTMRQSLLKSEHVCYNVKVRGGEAAKWGAMLDNKLGADDVVDEGFY